MSAKPALTRTARPITSVVTDPDGRARLLDEGGLLVSPFGYVTYRGS